MATRPPCRPTALTPSRSIFVGIATVPDGWGVMRARAQRRGAIAASSFLFGKKCLVFVFSAAEPVYSVEGMY